MAVTISAYLMRIDTALPAARESYFPMDAGLRKRRNLKLGREVGFGMGIYPNSDIDDYIQSLYGRLIVRNSFDSVGVQLDAKEWIAAVHEGIAQVREGPVQRAF